MKNIYFSLLILLFSSCLCFSQIGGYSLYFDGVDDYVSVPHSSNLNFTAFTAEAWVCCVGTSNGKILGKTASGNAAPGFNIGINDNRTYCFEVFGSSGPYLSKNTSITNASGIWTHVAMSWSTGGYMRCYVNGVEVGSVASSSFTITTSNNFIIGMAPWGLNQNYFKGKIDEVRLWSVVRTESEIKTNMYKELAGNESGLKAYYKMSDGSGTSLTDNQSNVTANTGTINNAATWEASGCFAGPRYALDFDGTDDFVSISNGVILGTTFSQEMWIYPIDVSEVYRAILGNETGSTFTRPPCVYQYGKKLHFGFGDNSNWNSDITANDVLTINTWNHLAFTFDGTTYLVYVNGRLVYTSLCASGKTPSGSALSLIGKLDNYYVGKIDELRIWNVVKTETQIRESMMCNLAGNESGLQAYFRMDYSDGTTLYDITSNGRNGTLTNMDPATDWVSSDAFNTWIGSESNAWSTALNWSMGSVPASTNNTGIYKWALGNELSLSGAPTLNHMLFSSTSSPTLNSSFTVNGEIILGRDIDLNGNTITLGSIGNLNEGSYRFYGSSGTITTTRTLNNISAQNVGGLGVTITTTADMGSTTITRGHTTQGSNSSISRYYDITPTTNSGLNATLEFSYNDNEMNWNVESDLKLFKSTNGGTNWSVQNSSTVNTTNNTITLTGIDGFSRWTAANYNSPMPVELFSFTSNISERNVKLTWQTCKEINNKGFEIERKCSESGWIKIGYVNGKGVSNEVTNYSYNDIKLNTGKYNYRLKQIDFNGNYAYHNLNGVIEIGIPSKFSLSQNYPNPFNPITKIDFELPVESKINIKIFDITGQEVLNVINNETRSVGYYSLVIDGSRLSSGVYFYNLTAGTYSETKKMILLK